MPHEPPPLKGDLAVLYDGLLRMATHLLELHDGELYPIGATISPDGEFTHIAVKLDSDQPPSAEVIDTLWATFRDQAAKGEIRACGVAHIVTLREPVGPMEDAIVLSLESRAGRAAFAIPFRLPMELGEPISLSAEQRTSLDG